MVISVIIACGLLAIGQFVGLVILGLMARRYVEARFDAIIVALDAELTKLVSKEPCQSGAVLNAIGEAVGARAGVAAKAALMADLSHAKRAVNTDANDQQLALIEEGSPGLGALFSGVGKRGRGTLLGNPLIQLALSALTGRSQGAPGNGATPGPGTGSVRSRIQKGG